MFQWVAGCGGFVGFLDLVSSPCPGFVKVKTRFVQVQVKARARSLTIGYRCVLEKCHK